MVNEQHTSGAERAAEVEATAEQLAQWEQRLRARADELVRELRNLHTAALTHSAAAGHIALAAHHAAETLDRGAHAYDGEVHRETAAPPLLVTSRDASPPGASLISGRGDEPPFAADLAVDQPPHER